MRNFDIIYVLYFVFFLLLIGTGLESDNDRFLLLGCLGLLAIAVIVLVKDYKRGVESCVVALLEFYLLFRKPLIFVICLLIVVGSLKWFIDFAYSPLDEIKRLSPDGPVVVTVVYPGKVNMDGEDFFKLRVALKDKKAQPRDVKVILTAENEVAHLAQDAVFVATTRLSETHALKEWYIPFSYDYPCDALHILPAILAKSNNDSSDERNACSTSTSIKIEAKVDQEIDLAEDTIDIRVVDFPSGIFSIGGFFVVVFAIMRYSQDIQRFIGDILSVNRSRGSVLRQ